MTFSPAGEGEKIAKVFPFETFCKFLEQVASQDTPKKRKSCVSSFIQKWSSKYTEICGHDGPVAASYGSFYPILRLLIPSADRSREAFRIGETTMARMLVKAFGLASKGSEASQLLKVTKSSTSRGVFNNDLADIVQHVLKGHCSDHSDYKVSKIHDILDELAQSQSHSQKVVILTRFVRCVTILELKWFVRIVSRRDLSFGIGEKAILACLHPSAPSVWDVTQDLYTVCQRITGIDPNLAPNVGTNFKSVELFTAFKPMLCSRANSVDDIYTAYLQDFSGSVDSGLCLEVKYDGERVQLHKSDKIYRFWSRSGREWSSSYGESGDSLSGSLTNRLHANGTTFANHVIDCILDGEMLAFDKNKQQFVTKATGFDVKKSKTNRESGSNKGIVPCYIVFDVLYLNGELLTGKSLFERKRILLGLFRNIKATCEEVSTEVEKCFNSSKVSEDSARLLSLFVIRDAALYLGGFLLTQPDKTRLERCFDTWVQRGAEGLVAKALSSSYSPNGRAHAGWWKLKPDYVSGLCADLDCLVVGAYATAGRTSCFSSFLCAVINDQEAKRTRVETGDAEVPSFLTFCQVTNGLKLEQLESINRRLGPHWRPYDRRKVNCGETEWLRVHGERPDFWVPPYHSIVLQIHAAEMTPSSSYSAGYTLRFPRVTALRDDKNWDDVVSASEVDRLFKDTKGKMIKLQTEHRSESESDRGEDGSGEVHSFSSANNSLANPAGSVLSKLSQKRARETYSVFPQLCPSSPDVPETESAMFKNIEFCLLVSSKFSTTTDGIRSKKDLEVAILKRGGTIVQNPCSSTTYVVTDIVTTRISNLIEATKMRKARGREGGFDIVSTAWLFRCIQANQLLALKEDEVFSARPSTKHLLQRKSIVSENAETVNCGNK